MSVQNWRSKHDANEIKVGVIGLGYVGLPLAVSFATHGHRVLGFDIDAQKNSQINTGRSYIPDVDSADINRLVEAGLLEATTEFSRLDECDAISVCVPTPLRKTREPDLTYIIESIEQVSRYLRKGQLVVLEEYYLPWDNGRGCGTKVSPDRTEDWR